jgi:hypothetical protein
LFANGSTGTPATGKNVLATVDLSNAFNCIDRSEVLAAVRRVAPDLAPWADFGYASDTALLMDSTRLGSARGVQQGDPLGPALFAIAIHPQILEVKRRVDEQFPGELDFTAFYLDDGTIAGTDQAVALFCTLFKDELAGIGLDLTFPKCEVIPAAGLDSEALQSLFPDFIWRGNGDFKLLGTPFGSAGFCTEHTRKRKVKSEALMKSIAELDDRQAALLLIRHCSSFCKLAYSARTVPPDLHRSALREFSAELRKALEQILGDELPERCWDQAKLGIIQGGVGLRDVSEHAAAAYVASVIGSRDLCKAIDSDFDSEDSAGGLGLAAARNNIEASILPTAAVEHSTKVSQKRLSKLIDAAAKQALLDSNHGDTTFKARVSLCSLPSAGVWLTSPPAEDRELDAPLFQVALKRRLRVPIFPTEACCPCCGTCMDRFGDHALICACKGDRTVRHNELRNRFYADAAEAGMRPEREKAGLLPSRPGEDGIRVDGGDRRLDSTRRRWSRGGCGLRVHLRLTS